jgi:cobalt-zinc-cadmium efflux system membrane fusion protein
MNNHHLHVELDVFEQNALYLKEGKKIKVNPLNAGIESFTAKVYGFPYQLDPTTRSVKVHAEIDNPSKQMFAGMAVKAQIEGVPIKVTSIPESALVIEGNKSYVFSLKSKTDKDVFFERIQVSVVAVSNGRAYVNGEIPKMIIAKGGYSIQSESVKEEE